MERANTRKGFSLIELMMVMLIISILVGLLLPVVNKALQKAKNLDSDLGGTRELDPREFFVRFHARLHHFYTSRPVYPHFELHELQRQGVLELELMHFMAAPPSNTEIKFNPFSSEDLPARLVLELKHPDGRVWILTKGNILAGPPPGTDIPAKKQSRKYRKSRKSRQMHSGAARSA